MASDDAVGRSPGRVEVLSDAVSGFDDLSALESVILRAAEAALDAEHTAGPDSVTVLLSDDRRLRDLNREFNGEDSVTDVLSFNEVDGWHNGQPPEQLTGNEFVAAGAEPRLGDIVISLQQAKRQADERSAPLERELAMLTVHGVLHLLGYDHADPDEERVMFGKTDGVLAGLFRE